jgi:hypothetical protein
VATEKIDDSTYEYATPMFMTQDGKVWGGIMTPQQVIQLLLKYKQEELDLILSRSMKMAIKDGYLIEDENDILKFKFANED